MKNVKGLRGLVVEDDDLIQRIIKANLESVGIISLVAGNGVEALEVLKNDTVDFVLMDIRMPDQDGLDTTRWIRDIEVDGSRSNLPIFALTSFDSPEHTKEIIHAGMNEHLIKPFELGKFLDVLTKYFPEATT
jgi:CheY-like chemotaxis protein